MIAGTRVASGAVGLVVGAAVVVAAVTNNHMLEHACFLGVVIGASLGAWIGAERSSPGRRLVPRLIATGLTLLALGHVLFIVLGHGGADTYVSIADPPWFASYLVLCAALWVVLRRSRNTSTNRVDVDFLIDVLTIVAVTVLITWSISVDAIAADDSVPPFARAVWAAYPLISSVLFALAVRALMSRSARAAIGVSFAVGAGLLLTGDMLYLQAPEGGTALVMMNATWMLAPVLAAHSVWQNGEVPADASGSPALGGWALMVAIGLLFVPAALVLMAFLRGEPFHPLQFFIGTLAVTALAFVRTARLIRSEGRARRELEAARDAALEASRAKSTFLANMSHEIRTPLTTVLAAGEILEDTPLDDLQLKLLRKMHRSGERLKTLVEGILDFSKIEAGQLELTTTTFDLHDMVADAAEPCALRALEAEIQFRWDLDPRVPETVVGDPNRVFQVLTNVLDNALKFTHHGQVGLHVRPAMPDDQGGRVGEGVEFVVEDTGIGISAEDQESVFESFSQVDGSMTRRYGGNGLGLAICRELTELMGGTITVQSQLSVGSTFVIRFPLIPAVEETAPVNAVPLLA